MNREDADYVINEIRWMDYYRRKAERLKIKIETVQYQIAHATDPTSPQGHENIGAGRSLTFEGKESYMNMKMEEEKKLQKEYDKFSTRYIDAQLWFYQIIDQTEEKDFARDYFSKKYTKQQLEEMYHLPKAYRKMAQIVMNAL